MRIAASSSVVLIGLSAVGLLSAEPVLAHGYAGARFFPATLLIEDPFVADELALPTFSWTQGGEERGAEEIEFEVEFAKRLTSRLAFSLEGAWVRESSDEGRVYGFENLGVGAKYQIVTDE